MKVDFLIRSEERDDTKAFVHVKAWLVAKGLVVDPARKATVRRNGGLWHYIIPVREEVTI